MGRRSRKRAEVPGSRAERDAARRRRAGGGAQAQAPRPRRRTSGERPEAPWGSFPLSELVIFVGIVLMAWGLLTWDGGGGLRFGGGLAIAALGGLELSLREHLGGFRSHTTLLSGAVAFAVVSAVALGLGPQRLWVLLAVAVAVFGTCFLLFRELFKRRSGGLGFR